MRCGAPDGHHSWILALPAQCSRQPPTAHPRQSVQRSCPALRGCRLALPSCKTGPCLPAAGKAYEITYVRLKFHTSRPESFAIYKRSQAGGRWEPYQYYSASCWKTYGRPEGQYLRPGQEERVAFCTSEFSDISPLSGGNVAFSTLEGRPSAYNFEGSPVLQVRGERGWGAGLGCGWDTRSRGPQGSTKWQDTGTPVRSLGFPILTSRSLGCVCSFCGQLIMTWVDEGLPSQTEVSLPLGQSPVAPRSCGTAPHLTPSLCGWGN